jgi:DNA-binding NarL/FixJ family response regulator
LIKIVIINGKEKCRNCLRANLSSQRDFQIVGIGSDGYEALKLVDMYKPDIVLLDVQEQAYDGVKTASLIKYRSPGTSIIIYTDVNEERRILSVFSSGISGYVTKKMDPELLYLGIHTVYRGGHLMAPEIASEFNSITAKMVMEVLKSRGELRMGRSFVTSSGEISQPGQIKAVNFETRPAFTRMILPRTISQSEIRLMGFVGQGFSNREIAEKLKLSEGTIRNYLSAVLQKTGLHDRTQVAIYAVKTGL